MKNLKAMTGIVLALALVFSAVVAAPAAAATPEEDVRTIESRLQEYYLSQGDEILLANGIYLARTSEALDYVQSQNADGSWSDVDYADRTSSANGSTWSAYIALYRMLALTQAYRDADAQGYGDPAVLAAVERALVHWDAVNPGNQNWWETEIGESIAMGRISIFLGEELSEEAFAVTLQHNTGKLDPVGANGAWRTSNYIFEALATRDIARIQTGFQTIVATIAVDDSGAVNEAVQPDASFWAHGAQLYSEGYGMVLFTYAALWADVARGTSLAFSRDQLDSIAFYIVNGTRWLIRGEIGMLYLNYRPPKTIAGVTSHASEFIEPLERMVRTDALYATSYQAVLDGILGNTRSNGITGDKYFWRSEFSSHLRDEYGIFTRLNSSRTFGGELRTAYRPELGNPVYWNSMGATAIQVTNREYLDLGPAFDWWHYPGVTAPYEKRTERGFENRTRNGDGAGFTGGVSNGEYGANVLTLDTAATTAQKSYFLFDDEMVALGAGIRSSSDAAVHTTINQAAAKPNAAVGGNALEPADAQGIGDATWAYNDEVGYVFAPGQDVKVSNKPQTGNWIDEDAVTRDAFTLYVDHGNRPDSASYDYTVLPAATSAEVEAYAADPAVRTIRNDTEVQAVRHDERELTMAAFYRAGSLEVGGGRTLTVDQPSIVLVDERGETPEVSVANPDRPGLTVTVGLTGPRADWHGTFLLGSGANLGRTVTADLVAGSAPEASVYSAGATADGGSVAALGDGDADTVWAADAEGPVWVSKRLARGSWVTKVTVDWADAYARDFLIQTSQDGAAWTDHTHVVDGTGGTTEVAITPTPATFVRILLLESDAEAFAIREFGVEAGVNLAADSATRASGYSGYNLVHLLADGDPATRWRGNNSDGAWAQVDLGRPQTVAAVRLSWEAAFAKSYKIQLSDDGTNWRDAYATPSAGSDGGIDVITFDETSARFVRMQTLKRALNYGPSLWEFEVFADTSVVDAPTVATGVENLALNRPATADSVYNGNATIVASKANDGSMATKWSSARARAEHWLQIDLESVRSVSRAIVHWETGTSNDYRIEGSADGTTWMQLARVEAAQPTLTHTHDFSPVDIRFVRVAGLPATQYGLNIWEIELYGGFTLECAAAVSTPAGSTATISANVRPVPGDAEFRAYSLDDEVVRVSGAGRAGDGGRIDVEGSAGRAGATSVLITHSAGDELAWCPVTVTADKAGLVQAVEQANGLNSADYTLESMSAVLSALESAKSTFRTESATQETVDQRTAALVAAMGGLVAAHSPVLAVSVEATPETRGKKVRLSVSVTNDDSVRMDVVVVTPYGEKTIEDVKPGKTVRASFNTKLAAVEAGEAIVTATATVDGESVTETTTVPYEAFATGR
ncbi:discoidin domain-containing protein [Microbacterium cremeum]|uniref:discoidin domain-containing protein n=1 Tax=Microbacterium cremeum TaxID=2782169 RepID=UPI001887A511|nr:discoidin domain-containing protein [Microbacterium cremeum]